MTSPTTSPIAKGHKKNARALPKGRVLHTELPRLFSSIPQMFHHRPMPKDAYLRGFPVAVIPCKSAKQAKALVELHGMSREEMAQLFVGLLPEIDRGRNSDPDMRLALNIVSALIPEDSQ